MDEIEGFIEECRADPWFQSRLDLISRLESMLTNFYLAGEGLEGEAIWNQVHSVIQRTIDTPVDRCQALAEVLQGLLASRKPN
jgi:hypothetical protein